MPILKNARHELFAQNLAAGMTQEKAYIAAGYKETPRCRMSACDLLRTKPYIKERVTELQSRNVQRQDEIAAISTESLLAEAEAARVKAMAERGGAAAAIQAIVAKGKLSGRWIEKSETVNKSEDLSTYSDAQLAAIIKGSDPDKTQH